MALGVAGALACVAVGVARAHAPEAPLDATLREQVHKVQIPAVSASIVVSSYRPQGEGPFPWIVLSHGTATTMAANKAMGRNRNLPLMREWIQRGYAVIVPVRRGYGASGGERLADGYGGCDAPRFWEAGEGAALDLLAAVDWAKAQRDLDPKRWLFVGQSAGGFASIYTASKQPDGLLAVLAFAPGRGGNPDRSPGVPCASDRMAEVLVAIAPRITVPVLWFYAENDAYFGPRVQKYWFESFRSGGGRGELVVIPPFPERRGHGVLAAASGVPHWSPAVAAFMRSQRLALAF